MKHIPVRAQVNIKDTVRNDGASRLPHERDQAPDDQSIEPKKKMKQAYLDLQQGQVDTDMHGERGVEKTVSPPIKTTRKKSAR